MLTSFFLVVAFDNFVTRANDAFNTIVTRARENAVGCVCTEINDQTTSHYSNKIDTE